MLQIESSGVLISFSSTFGKEPELIFSSFSLYPALIKITELPLLSNPKQLIALLTPPAHGLEGDVLCSLGLCFSLHCSAPSISRAFVNCVAQEVLLPSSTILKAVCCQILITSAWFHSLCSPTAFCLLKLRSLYYWVRGL